MKKRKVDNQEIECEQILDEHEAEAMLQPLFEKYISEIEENKFKGRTLEEIEANCQNNT